MKRILGKTGLANISLSSPIYPVCEVGADFYSTGTFLHKKTVFETVFSKKLTIFKFEDEVIHIFTFTFFSR